VGVLGAVLHLPPADVRGQQHGGRSLMPVRYLLAYCLLAGLANWLATLIVTRSTLFGRPRQILPPLACPLCAGTWVALAEAAMLRGWPLGSVFWSAMAFKAIAELVAVAVGRVTRRG